MITTATSCKLQECLCKIKARGAVALDTEFVWTETYYPNLGVVQLGLAGDEAWLIDAPALDDTAAIKVLIEDPDIVKVLHDARQDLCILKSWCGALPRAVFDTRLAAGFCGFSASISLQALVRDVLGIEMEKSETQTDWLRRPLSARQVHYALNDVRHMLELRERLLDMAQARGTLAWLNEEMLIFDAPALYAERPLSELWERIKGASRLDGSGLAVLREIAVMRETTARHHNLPRAWVMDDPLLLTLAERPPQSAADLLKVYGLSDKHRARIGPEILEACRRGQAVTRDQLPSVRRSDNGLKKRADDALAWLKERGAAMNVDPTLFGNRAEITAIISNSTGNEISNQPLLRGWRYQAAGRDFLAQFGSAGGSGAGDRYENAAYGVT